MEFQDIPIPSSLIRSISHSTINYICPPKSPTRLKVNEAAKAIGYRGFN